MVACIQPLPDDVVSLIAAGEVIDSLAAAVRELVENAIDAGATRITVTLWPDLGRLQVVDNGAGMTLTDLQQAALPHRTSKIRSGADLWQITSLGFRGEALHSLAQLADLRLCSRPQETPEDAVASSMGWGVTYDAHGNPQQVETIAIAPGTIAQVDNLFGRWPSRRQSLPTIAQQLRAVQLTIQHLALCHPQITWQVNQSDRPWFSLYPGPSARVILPQILRGVADSNLRDLTRAIALPESTGATHNLDLLKTPPPRASLNLVLGLPDRCHRRRPDWVKVAVNGRLIQSPELAQTLLNAFGRTLPRDRYPVCFLHLQIPPSEVDWHRHPAKAEVYLRHLEHWQAHIQAAVGQILQLQTQETGVVTGARYSDRIQQVLKSAEAATNYSIGNYSIGQQSTLNLQPTNFQPTNFQPTKLPLVALRAIAQVHQTYIVAEHSSGLWLVEQHIAHERVLYEQLCDRWQLVPLEPPVILEGLTAAQREQLERLGITVDPFGETLWAVRQAPALLASREDCGAALVELSLAGDLQAAQVATACRSAIRNGTPLTLPEMQALLDQWQQTRNPRTCPHGRPIYLALEESALARFFRRHWVIGKSHGLQ
ncbi:DNA mismatch repair endonuclease MutL [Trichothermofontia sp.]